MIQNNQGVSAKINTKQRSFSKNGLPMPSQLSIYPKEFRICRASLHH
jgi:hypothetical protein